MSNKRAVVAKGNDSIEIKSELGEVGEENNLHSYIDQQRWLLNNGLLNDLIKDQLFVYGSIVHRQISAVELKMDVENKHIIYYLFAEKKLLKKIDKFNELRNSKGLWSLWKFKRLLKKEGNLDFDKVIGKFVLDYCGAKWTTEVILSSIEKYVDGYDEHEKQHEENQKVYRKSN